MKIAVSGKGGAGKTMLSGTLARVVLARSGRKVHALDADTNPMLGVSLGLGPEETDILVAARQALDEGAIGHEPNIDLNSFGELSRVTMASSFMPGETGCPDGEHVARGYRVLVEDPCGSDGLFESKS